MINARKTHLVASVPFQIKEEIFNTATGNKQDIFHVREQL